MIIDAGLLVFDAQGAPLLQLDLNSARCGLGTAFSFPDRAFLSQDDVLVLGYDLLQTGLSRACAVDFAGHDIETIVTDAATAMGVVDYRRNVGFLVSNGVFSNGSWINVSTSLRNAATTRWSVPGVHLSEPSPALAPNGDAWVSSGDHVTIYDSSGAIRGSVAEYVYPRMWLAGGDALIANDGGTDLRRVHGDGSAVWQRTLSDAFGTPQWQQFADRARMLQVDFSSRLVRTATLALADGAVISEQAHTFDFPQGAGLVASDRLVMIDRGVAFNGWVRDFTVTCEEVGYCPDRVDYAQPDIAVFAQATGGMVSAVAPWQTAFPLHTRLRESQPKVYPVPDGSGAVIHVQYFYSGDREVTDVIRINSNGERAWRVGVAFARFDAASAAAVVTGDAVYVSHAANGPHANQRELCKFDLEGHTQWCIDLPRTIAQWVAVSQPGDAARICGISVGAFPHWLCVSASGDLVRDVALPIGNDEKLRIQGSESGFTVVRRVPANDWLTDEIAMARIDLAGNCVALPLLAFEQPPSPQRLRVDVVRLGTTILATALVHGSSDGSGRPIALVIANFDRNGNRLWQRRIDTPLRGIDEAIVNSAIAVNGVDVFIGLHPYANNAAFPIRICRFATDGTAGACTDAPMQGRVNAMLRTDDEPGVLVWASALGLGSSINHPDGMVVYRFANDAFSAGLVTVPGFRSDQPGSVAVDGTRAWFVVQASATSLPQVDPTNASTAVIALSLINLFGDGFE